MTEASQQTAGGPRVSAEDLRQRPRRVGTPSGRRSRLPRWLWTVLCIGLGVLVALASNYMLGKLGY